MKTDKNGFPISRVYDYASARADYAAEYAAALIVKGVTFTCYPHPTIPHWVMIRTRKPDRARTLAPIIGA